MRIKRIEEKRQRVDARKRRVMVTRSVKPRPWINPQPLMIGLVGAHAGNYEKIGVCFDASSLPSISQF